MLYGLRKPIFSADGHRYGLKPQELKIMELIDTVIFSGNYFTEYELTVKRKIIGFINQDVSLLLKGPLLEFIAVHDQGEGFLEEVVDLLFQHILGQEREVLDKIERPIEIAQAALCRRKPDVGAPDIIKNLTRTIGLLQQARERVLRYIARPLLEAKEGRNNYLSFLANDLHVLLLSYRAGKYISAKR